MKRIGISVTFCYLFLTDRDVTLYVKDSVLRKDIFESCKKYYDEASEAEKKSIIYYEHPELFTEEEDERTSLNV